jgi:hypothetical protein
MTTTVTGWCFGKWKPVYTITQDIVALCMERGVLLASVQATLLHL